MSTTTWVSHPAAQKTKVKKVGEPAGKRAKKAKIPKGVKLLLPVLCSDIMRAVGAIQTIENSPSSQKLVEVLLHAEKCVQAYIK
jgi:hypothetical protein